jgi:prophage antirepressor-like protein
MPEPNNLFTPLNADFTLFNEQSGIRKQRYKNERYFSVVDIVFALTQSKNPLDYLKKLRLRDPALKQGWGQIVTPLWQETKGGRQKLNFANTAGSLRIIQSIPSPNAEPLKRWLASLGNERLEEMNNPEL